MADDLVTCPYNIAHTIQRRKEYFIQKINILPLERVVTSVCGVTSSASPRRWGGEGFNSRPKPRHS